MKPGIWNVCHTANSTHLSLMPIWLGTQKQKEFWIDLGEWLARVDDAREDQRALSDIDVENPAAHDSWHLSTLSPVQE